jgi:hypothetical protein
MLIGGCPGEGGIHHGVWPGFIIGTLGWFFFHSVQIFCGVQAGKSMQAHHPPFVPLSEPMRWIVTIGWAILPYRLFLWLHTHWRPALKQCQYTPAKSFTTLRTRTEQNRAFGLIIWTVAVSQKGL